jgi:hypothetical protein
MNVYTGLLMLGGYISNADLAIALSEASENTAQQSPQPLPDMQSTCAACPVQAESL